MESPIDFCTLFLVPEGQYVSDAMTEVLNEAKSRELELTRERFSIESASWPLTKKKKTDVEAIVADGFRFSYPADE